jgi:DNA repair exonuclease SbcCD ATPase subunit
MEQDEQKRRRRLNSLANRLGVGCAEDFLASFEEWRTLQQETVELQRLRARWEGARDELRRLREEVCRWCECRGIALQDNPSSELLRRVLADVDRALNLSSQLEEIRRRILEREGDLYRTERQLHERGEAVKDLLREAGLDDSLRGEEARTAFDQAVERAQRFRQLAQEIEQERRQLLLPEERSRLRRRREELAQRIAQMESDGVAGAADPEPGVDRIFYQRRLDQLTNDSEEIREEISRLDREIRATLQETRSLPKLYQELKDLKQSLKRAEQVERAVAIAKDTLRHISAEVYEIWAEHLNRFATRAFQEILPHYGKPRFERDLRLTFIHPETGQRIHTAQDRTPPRLSGGTLEQLYFIIRAAIADFFSQGETTLPLILDEPFPHSHDERFLKGMRLLAERLAVDRQVIVFSCHEVRHRWLLAQVPPLKERIYQVRFCKATQ